MPKPREIFDQPDVYWSFLTSEADVDCEDQFFDRKEAGRVKSNGIVDKHTMQDVVDEITECVSAFANANMAGGLLVLGLSKTGEVKGISHLTDEQRNRITNINAMLSNQATRVKLHDCQSDRGEPDKICLVYVPYTEYALCETPGNVPKAWLRQGAQNILMSQQQRERIQRDKRIIDFEQGYCCPFDARDIDQAVLKEFRDSYFAHHSDVEHEYGDEELLYQVGALARDERGYTFTNAGFLFFAANPQRKLTTTYIRLLRFEAEVEDSEHRGLPSFERVFSGPLTKQIRDIRTFFQESGFFKVYQRRNAEGGFLEEPEYPYITIDEAIVNAVAHRDYAMSLPIECESYRNAFVVRNSGRILQRDRDVPSHFSLETTRLVSTPRNPKLIEWLKIIRDARGSAFVRALSEGTKRMSDEMAKLHLIAPMYQVSEAQTTVKLFNNAVAREALMRATSMPPSIEFANLFPLSFLMESGEAFPYDYVNQQRKNFMVALKDTLVAKEWFIDNFKFGRLVAHLKGLNIPVPNSVAQFVGFYPAYSFQLRSYWGRFYLCIDYTLEVKNMKTVRDLMTYLKPDELVGRTAVAQWKKEWQACKIVSIEQEWTHVHFFDLEQEEQIASNKVIPNLPTKIIEQVLNQQSTKFDLYQAIKEHSLALELVASRLRLDKTLAIARNIAEEVFPLTFSGVHVYLQPSLLPLARNTNEAKYFQLSSLPEPSVEFNHHHEAVDIRSGITTFGAYDNSRRTIELIPICTASMRENMVDLIERLKAGKYKYRGSERTFSTRFAYSSIVTVPSPELILSECKRLVDEHPEWIGDELLQRIFLVHTPEKGYASDDEQSPYYSTKRFLFENGLPCQMLDTPTLQNPDWKDLNLALNITAKCGVTPWVLPDAIPDADFFVGLSYTSSAQRGGERLMGYANVFNQYGRWEFYSGNTTVFTYSERVEHFRSLIHQTLERLPLSETPSIYFHYSAKFSREDCDAILDAARSIRPQGTYSFVWINTQHNVRLYDSRPETNGSLSRGSYVITSPHQFYLSTTGNNPYRKMLGTPKILEVNISVYRPEKVPNSKPDLRGAAIQLLSLTKLNWASTDSLSAEPITTKYAGDIAYLTSAFLRQNQNFRLHKVLEKTPWFI